MLPQVDAASLQHQRLTTTTQAPAHVGYNDHIAQPLTVAPDRSPASIYPIQSCSLSDLSTYTGSPPNEFAKRIIQTLEANGFTVAPTAQGPNGQRKTLRISWRGVFVGLMSEGLWGRKVPYACLYRFMKNGASNSVAKAPQGFDKDDFARKHGCDPNLLHVHSDYSGSYLWVQDEITTLRLMQDWARRIDDLFGNGSAPIY